MEEKQYSKVK